MPYSYSSFPTSKLQQLDFQIKELNQVTIENLYYKQLTTHTDGRGNITELWSQPWSKNENVESEIKHVYYNTTHQGVIKAWHIHEKTVSQYTCLIGKMHVVLTDLNENSSTYGHVNQFLIGQHNPSLIKIPPGVLKGWKSIQNDSVIINILTSADLSDNYRYPWDSILSDLWLPKNG